MNFYKFTNGDLSLVIKFVRDYHLNLTKSLGGRTNTGKRGFGGELDEWIPGKLLEIAVCRILEKFNDKKLSPDFKIYSNKEVGERSDPDITSVKENLSIATRKPNVFVEIKRFDPKARWMGPREHQLKDMNEGFMVHASIEFKDDNNKKQRDITASVVKEIIKPGTISMHEFSDFKNLTAKIEYVYSFKKLREKGHFFESGNIIPDTDFPKVRDAYKKDGSLSKVYILDESYSGEKKLKMKWLNKHDSLSYGDWTLSGEFKILKDKTGRKFIYAVNNVKMFSEVFGLFYLDNSKTYKFHFINTLGKRGGKDIFKAIDDYWFSKKRLDELLKDNEIDCLQTTIKTIAQKI